MKDSQELTKILDELNAVLLRRVLSKKKQEKRERFYNKRIQELKEQANKLLGDKKIK